MDSNFVLFFPHILFVTLLTVIAARMGKETLTVLFCLFTLVPNLFILKQIDVYSFTITCCEPYIIAAFLSLNMIQYLYGKKAANKAIYSSLFVLVAFTVLSLFQLTYTPSVHDTMHSQYESLLKPVPKIFLSSIVIGFIAQKLDLKMQHLFKNKWPKAPFILLMFLPICISQGFDTFAFSYIALFNEVHSVFNVAIVAYITKIVVALTMGGMVRLFARLIQKKAVA